MFVLDSRFKLSPTLSLTARLRSGSFSPSALFANGEVGVWYDPSPETTFTDTAGTIPATVGSAVALMLDKSKGLVLGPELVTNGGFDTDTDWNKGTGWTIAGGVASCDGSQTANSSLDTSINPDPIVQGKTYVLEMDVVSVSAGTVQLLFSEGGGSTGIVATSVGSYKVFLNVVNPNTNIRVLASPDFAGSIDNISVRELPGYHATQGTTAARPILARVPARGRANLLTRTEEFDNVDWVKQGLGAGTAPVVTSNAALAPDGTMTADRVVFTLPSGAAVSDFSQIIQNFNFTATTHTGSIYIKSNTGASQDIVLVLQNAQVATVTATTEWQRVSRSLLTSVVSSNFGLRARGTFTADTVDLLVWGAQIEQSSTASAYQKVTSTYDVTEAGQADNYFLWFDGVDDVLISPNAVFFGDASSMVLGAETLAAAGKRTVTADTATIGLHFATFEIYGFVKNYTVGSGGVLVSTGYPNNRVVSWLRDEPQNSASIRVDGVQRASTTHDQTDNVSRPLTLGGLSGGLFGRLNFFSLVHIARSFEANELTQTEKYVSTKTAGVDLT